MNAPNRFHDDVMNVIPFSPRAEPEVDPRRLEAELVAAELRGARAGMGVLATGALRSR